MGKFEAGDTRPINSGRKAGTPNKRTVLLTEILEGFGCDVPQKIVELLPQLPAEKQVDVLLDLMSFMYPRRKAIEQEITAQVTSVDMVAGMSEEELHQHQRAILLKTAGVDIDNKEEMEQKLIRNLHALEMLRNAAKKNLDPQPVPSPNDSSKN